MAPDPLLKSAHASYAIVGGGIIGLAVAYQLTKTYPDAKITLFEKESEVGQHQSGHNSGVLHAGLYYKPGSLKAKLATTGIRRMVQFCQENGILHERCGKLVVATEGDEIPRLKELLARGEANGLQGLRWCGPEQIREREPHVAGLAGVEVPEEGIVDYPAVCRKLVELIRAAGGRVLTGAGVRSMKPQGRGWLIQAGEHEVEASFIFNCAGLQCDRVLELAGETRAARIVPFRGEYFMLTPEGASLVKHLIYPVPDPKFPFLGVHYTRMIHGGVEAGPNAVLATAREGYSWRKFVAADVADVFTFPGFWKFLRKYPSMAFYEVKRSLIKEEFCKSLQRLIPAIELKHLTPGGAGVRAQALSPDGTLLQDFDFVLRQNALHLINAPSPGATASLAIADYLIDQVRIQQP